MYKALELQLTSRRFLANTMPRYSIHSFTDKLWMLKVVCSKLDFRICSNDTTSFTKNPFEVAFIHIGRTCLNVVTSS